ncbi:MAG: insulinase family protein [Bacteroidaceae bacterium]|nr:insulinase family protein [Bacteroidaceae bacterium]
MNKKNIMPFPLVVMAVACQTLFAQQANERMATDSKDRNDSIPTREEIVRDSVLAAEAGKRRDSLIMLHSDIIDQQVIPADTSVRTGVLKNGLTYYVRRCTEPKGKANFNLLVKGGSFIEKENERGLAHFVEHMQFKGTKHFPGREVIGFMQRNGIPFGHDSNAFTGYTTVRYFLNSIPTGDVLQIDSCLLLLRDWACDATIDDNDVESERNVIVEEWRSRNTVSITQQFTSDLLNNSLYTERSPIGDLEIVRNCPPKLVRNFYKYWYQPQNQAVVVTGDFDADEMVGKIKKMFGTMKRGKHIVPEPPAIPDFVAPQVHVYQEPRLPFHVCSVIIRVPKEENVIRNKVGDLRSEHILDKSRVLMNDQLEALKSNDILMSRAYNLNLADIKNTKFIVYEMSSSPDKWSSTLETLLKKIEIIRRKGFTDFKRNPDDRLSPSYNEDFSAILFPDTVYSKYSKFVSKISIDWTDRLVNSFFNGNAINDYSSEEATKGHIANTTTKEQLDKMFRDMTDGHNMLVTTMFPKDATLPTEEDVMVIFHRVRNMKDEELTDVAVEGGKKLETLHINDLDINPTPGTVVKTTVRNDSISELLLSNGVKILLWKKKTDNNSINMMFDRPMGYSALRDEEIGYHSMLSCRRHFEYIGSSWWGLNQPFDDIMDVLLPFHATNSVEQWKNIEQQLKMIHASLTTVEVDSVEAADQIKGIKTTIMAAQNPIMQAQLRLQNLPAASVKRLMSPSLEEAGAYSVERFREVVKDYYSNFNGSVFVVQGEVDADTLRPLLLKYIGSLPSKPEPVKRRTWEADHYKTTNTTVVEKIENATPFCTTYLFYTWEKGFQYTQQTHAHNQVLMSVLGKILLNTLRIQHSDVYTPHCIVQDDLLPVQRMKCTIVYTCDPKQRERIAKDVTQLVLDMAEGNLITQDLIDSYITEREKLKDNYKDNDYSLRSDLLASELNGIVIKKGDTSHIKQVTPASLKAHLKQLLKKGNLHIGYLTTE